MEDSFSNVMMQIAETKKGGSKNRLFTQSKKLLNSLAHRLYLKRIDGLAMLTDV